MQKIAECLFSGYSICGIFGITVIIVTVIICRTIWSINCKKIEVQAKAHQEKKIEAEKYILLCPCEKCKFSVPPIKEKQNSTRG